MLATLFLCLGCSALGCRSAGASAPTYPLEIEARTRQLEREFQNGNLLGVADLFADDALLIDSAGARVTGRQELDELWSAIEAPVDWRIEIHEVFGSDTLAYELGRSHQTSAPAGTAVVASADFLWLWRREKNGDWRIALAAHWPVAEP